MLHHKPDCRFYFVDDFLLADDLLLQRLALRLDHFSRLETQGKVVPAFPQERFQFPGEDRFALFGETLQCSGHKLRFERLAEPLKSGLCGIREDLRRSRKVLGKLGAYVLDHFGKLRFAQEVRFGEQYADFRCVLVQALQQVDVTLRKRRVDADRHQGEPRIRQPVQRCLRVVRKRALQTGRIDELQPAESPQFGQLYGDEIDLPGVFRILLLGDVQANLVERNLEIVAIAAMNPCLFAGAVADFRDHSRNRYDPDRKNASSDEVVQETTLAGLESPQHGDADFVLPHRCSCTREQAGKRGNLVPRRHTCRQVQGRLQRGVEQHLCGSLAGIREMGRAVCFGVDALCSQ